MHFVSIDKAMNSLGARHGYALPQPKLPNPVNIIMVHAQKVSTISFSNTLNKMDRIHLNIKIGLEETTRFI